MDDAVAALTARLGSPTSSETQVDAEVDRTVTWSDPDLYLEFTRWVWDDPPHSVGAGPVLHFYWTSSDGLRTEAGIGVGSTVAELITAYPEARFGSPADGCDYGWRFAVDHRSGWLGYTLYGTLDGDFADPGSRVVAVYAGLERTPC